MAAILGRLPILMSCILALLAPAAAVSAQEFPSKPIRVIVASSGGTMDVVIRTLAEAVKDSLQLVVEARAGGAGNIAGEAVARAEPDGHTLLLGHDGIHATNPHLFKGLAYDPIGDFTPVILIGSFPIALAVTDSLPVRTVPEFVAFAKANPGKIDFGSGGIATSHHLAGEMLKRASGIDIVHVPYKGADGVGPDLMEGRLKSVFISLGSGQQLAQSGKVRVIAIADAARSPLVPNIPAIAESYPDVVSSFWLGLLAPRATPPDRVARIERVFSEALRRPDVVARLADRGVSVINADRAAFAARIRADYEKRGELLKSLGVQPN